MWLSLALVVVTTGALHAESQPLIEVQLGKQTLQGRVAAYNDQSFWLMCRDGRLHGLTNDKVHKYRQVSPQFSGLPGDLLRDLSRREFGKSFDVVGTRHYTVCAVGEKKVRNFAETL